MLNLVNLPTQRLEGRLGVLVQLVSEVDQFLLFFVLPQGRPALLQYVPI